SASDIKVIRRTLNHSLSTYALDAAAPDRGPDPAAIEDWVSTPPEIGQLVGDGPVEGPNEPPVPEAAITEVLRQLESLGRQMGLGSRSSPARRSSRDLGRYGLGLKTASFSQAKRLTVGTKQAGTTSLRCWDLDYVTEIEDWRLLRQGSATFAQLADERLAPHV